MFRWFNLKDILRKKCCNISQSKYNELLYLPSSPLKGTTIYKDLSGTASFSSASSVPPKSVYGCERPEGHLQRYNFFS